MIDASTDGGTPVRLRADALKCGCIFESGPKTRLQKERIFMRGFPFSATTEAAMQDAIRDHTRWHDIRPEHEVGRWVDDVADRAKTA